MLDQVASEGHVVVAALDQCARWQKDAIAIQESQSRGVQDLMKTMSDLQDRDGLPSGLKAKSVAADVAELERQVQLLSNCVKDRDQQIQTLLGDMDAMAWRINMFLNGKFGLASKAVDALIADARSSREVTDEHRRTAMDLRSKLSCIPMWIQRLFGA